ncbi:hypothetical protein ACL1E4_11560 [Corynebacterium striatum]
MKENPLQYRVRGTPVPTTRTRGTNYPKSTVTWLIWPAGVVGMFIGITVGKRIARHVPREKARMLSLSVASLGAFSALVRGLLSL